MKRIISKLNLVAIAAFAGLLLSVVPNAQSEDNLPNAQDRVRVSVTADLIVNVELHYFECQEDQSWEYGGFRERWPWTTAYERMRAHYVKLRPKPSGNVIHKDLMWVGEADKMTASFMSLRPGEYQA